MCKKGLPAVWTKEKIEEAFAGFVEKNRRLPVAREMIWAADTQNI